MWINRKNTLFVPVHQRFHQRPTYSGAMTVGSMVEAIPAETYRQHEVRHWLGTPEPELVALNNRHLTHDACFLG
jgi:hypothetical protein